MTKTVFFCLLCWGLAGGCTISRQQLPQVVLSYNDPVVEMRLSEITDSLEIIPLETSDSVLIPESFALCIGRKYMVLEYSDALHQFSREGKYIRKMLQKGRGPDEYLFMGSQIIDDGNQHYYMTDGTGNLFTYDLEEGKLRERHKLASSMYFLGIKEDTIVGYPVFLAHTGTSPYSLCAFTSAGEIVKQLSDTVADGTLFSLSYIQSPEGRIYQKTIQSDTVWEIINWQKIPSFLLRGKYIDHRVPLTIVFNGESAGYYFFYALPVSIEYDQDGKLSSLSLLASGKNYRVHKTDFSPEVVEQVYVDSLGLFIPFGDMRMGSKMLWLPVSSLKFQEDLKEKAAKHQLSPALEKLYREVREDDNPLIIIGHKR